MIGPALRFAAVLLTLVLGGTSPLLAQETQSQAPDQPKAASDPAKPATQSASDRSSKDFAKPGLPPDATSQHTLELQGRTLQFEAVAGSIPLANAEGQVQGRIAYISYTLSGADAKSRPVAFAVNGGPGASSAWLQLGALGPWRLSLEGDDARPSASGVTVANAETWLDFTDLVFIDPIGTGYSDFAAPSQPQSGQHGEHKGASREELRKRFWSLKGDIDALATFIFKWTAKTGRSTSPKLLVGESYGGFRVPKLAHTLQTNYGIGTNLLVLVSPVLDYGFLRGQRHLPINTVALLPSLAAAAMQTESKVPSPALMHEAEDYARGAYLTDLMRGPRDKAAVDRIVDRVSALTKLPAETVRRYGGRLDSFGYRHEANQDSGRIASAYDASITGLNPNPTIPYAHAEDPFMTALRAPLTAATIELYATRLGWHTEARYQVLNGEVAGNWHYGTSPSPPEVVSDLKASVALDPRLRVLVAHGYTDLVTPYFADTMLLDQLPAYGEARRIVQITYPGGHMFYSRDASRAAFREDALILLAASLSGEQQTR